MPALDDFDYDLPERAIAQTPCEPRDAARLLDAVSGDGGQLVHRRVSDLPTLLRSGDVVVLNDTRVLPARLVLHKHSGGLVEVMLLDPEDVTDPADRGDAAGAAASSAWRALVRPGRRVPAGTLLLDDTGVEVIEVGDDRGDGIRSVRTVGHTAMLDLAHRIGTVPLPPYITGTIADPARYQTVYARNERSVAAPTAGLHFTPDLLVSCEEAGAVVLRLELDVGLGTFRPIMVDDIGEHTMHAERFRVEPEVLEACTAAERVIAIGTTTVRALESAATLGRLDGATELFISPGYPFKVVDVLMTNFHQPRSSLLVMLSAFAGERWRNVYREALAADYRFLSFGDAMIIDRQR